MNLFGGFVPMVGTGGYWAYTRWAQRAFVTIELVHGYGLSASEYDAFVTPEWVRPDWRADLGCLGAFAAATAGIALALTMLLHRDRQR